MLLTAEQATQDGNYCDDYLLLVSQWSSLLPRDKKKMEMKC